MYPAIFGLKTTFCEGAVGSEYLIRPRAWEGTAHMMLMPESLMKRHHELSEDKCAIAYHVVGLLDHGDDVYVDTGTTTANIFDLLKQTDRDMSVRTHSAFALMNVGARNRLFVIGGQLDNRYGAYYPEDRNNQRFKEALIRKCLDNRAIRLLIVADWTKFITRKGPQSWQAVVRSEEWEEVRRRKDYVLVTRLPDATVPAVAAASARRMMERFQKNERNRGMHFVAFT